MDLLEWTSLFLKHQDLLKKEILTMTPREQGSLRVLDVQRKNRAEEWILSEVLSDALALLNKEKRQGIVCLNTKTNFDALVVNWPALSSHPTLKIVFANPRANDRWTISPAHHAAIADKASLKTGLQAMFEAVPQA